MELSFIQIGLILIVTMIAAVDQFNFLESLYRPIVIGFGNPADGKASEADFTLHYKLTTK